jgi:hypothetical protein
MGVNAGPDMLHSPIEPAFFEPFVDEIPLSCPRKTEPLAAFGN